MAWRKGEGKTASLIYERFCRVPPSPGARKSPQITLVELAIFDREPFLWFAALSRVRRVETKPITEITNLTERADGLLPNAVYVGLREYEPSTDVSVVIAQV